MRSPDRAGRHFADRPGFFRRQPSRPFARHI